MIRIPKNIKTNNIACIFCLLCLRCVGQYLGITTLNLLLTILIVGLAFVAELDELFVIMYATLPLYNVINYQAGTYSMHYIIIAVFIAKYCFATKVHIYKLLAFLMLFVLRIFAADFVLLISWSILILPMLLTLDSPIWGRCIHRVILWMNASTILSCVTGYIMMITDRTIYTASYLYIGGVRTVRFAGLTGDSVAFGQTCVLMIGINLLYCYFNPNRKTFYVVTSALLAIASLLSYSKMTLACTVIIVLIFLVLYGKEYARSGKKLLRSIIVVGVLIVMTIALVAFLMSYRGDSTLILGYIDRFTRDDLSTGRFSLWGTYLEMLTSQPRNLLIPLTNEEMHTPIWNPSTGTYISYMHNLYLETVAVFGWCSAIIIFIWLIHRLFKFVAQGNKFVLGLPMFVILFMGIGSHGNLEYQFYLQFALALALLNPEMAQTLKVRKQGNIVSSYSVIGENSA